MQAYPHHYHASATGGADGSVVVSGKALPDIDTQPPPEFGGPGGNWSPETLLTAAVANCFVLSFRAIARASKLESYSINCDVEGVLDRVEGVTQFTHFNLSAVLHVPAEIRVERIQRMLEKSEQICLVTASLKSKIALHTDIQLG